MNVVVLTGRIGQDPDNRMTGNGTAVCNISVATNRFSGGEKKTDWHRCVLWGKAAETAATYLRKGSEVCVTGEIQYRSFDGKDGQKVHMTEIHCHKLTLIGGKAEGAGSAPKAQGQSRLPPPMPPLSDDNDVPF